MDQQSKYPNWLIINQQIENHLYWLDNIILSFLIILIIFNNESIAKENSFLNVSYDSTRELYKEINKSFSDYWYLNHHKLVKINQSHASSSKQARAIIDGLPASIATLAADYDLEMLNKHQLLEKNWLIDNQLALYNSTIVFLTRTDNPKQIYDWDDLIKPNIKIITANPKTSGGAKWAYLAAWYYYLVNNHYDEQQAIDCLKKLYKNVEILDNAARTSVINFTKRAIGDVLITWENEALYLIKNYPNKFRIIAPSISIKINLYAVLLNSKINHFIDQKLLQGYLNYLHSDEAQEIIAKNHYRPGNSKIMSKYSKDFVPIKQLIEIKEINNDIFKLHQQHFDDGAIFDQIYDN